MPGMGICRRPAMARTAPRPPPRRRPSPAGASPRPAAGPPPRAPRRPSRAAPRPRAAAVSTPARRRPAARSRATTRGGPPPCRCWELAPTGTTNDDKRRTTQAARCCNGGVGAGVGQRSVSRSLARHRRRGVAGGGLRRDRSPGPEGKGGRWGAGESRAANGTGGRGPGPLRPRESPPAMERVAGGGLRAGGGAGRRGGAGNGGPGEGEARRGRGGGLWRRRRR